MFFVPIYYLFILFCSLILHNGIYILCDDNSSFTTQRIIGGNIAKITEFSSAACLIRYTLEGFDFKGGAVIIGEYWALTTAHCMLYINRDEIMSEIIFVHSNSTSWNKHYSNHMVIESYSHENYNRNLTDFDIALLKVKTPFEGFNEKPVKLPSKNYKYIDNSIATVLGWGTTDAGAVVPFTVSNLRYSNIKIINFNICKNKYKKAKEVVTNRMICASSPEKDACVYDSGGPLYQDDYLIGLVSWGGKRCADNRFPGVYTKVSIFHHWIMQKLSDYLKCRKQWYHHNMIYTSKRKDTKK